jgi:hypothetical protein
MTLPTALTAGTPGFYRLGSVDVDRLRAVFGERLFVADCGSVATKAALFEAMGAGFAFPGYASANWDALLDLLRDLEWLGEGPRCLVFASTGALSAAEPATFRTLTEVLRDAATFWAKQPDNATAFVLELPGDTQA